MRKVFAAFIASIAFAGAALAADADGRVTKVDPEQMTIMLDDGKTYKLPPEMDMSAIAEGAEVIIAYEAKDGVNQITDMLIQ
jgi:outer membrane lipoprotein SlyB